MESNTEAMFDAGDQEPCGCILRVSKHILPSLSIFGWNTGVLNRMCGGSNGYRAGMDSDKAKTPSANGDSSGPTMLARSSSGSVGECIHTDMPGGGSLTSMSISLLRRPLSIADSRVDRVQSESNRLRSLLECFEFSNIKVRTTASRNFP